VGESGHPSREGCGSVLWPDPERQRDRTRLVEFGSNDQRRHAQGSRLDPGGGEDRTLAEHCSQAQSCQHGA
jgi:hypothetical protein